MKKNKFLDWLEIITSAIIVWFLLVMLWYSLKFWNAFYLANYQLIGREMLMFYVGLLIAVVTVSAQWIEGRIKTIIRAWNSIKGGSNGRKRRKETSSRVNSSNDTNSSSLQVTHR